MHADQETNFRFYCRMLESMGGEVPVYTPPKTPGLIERLLNRKRTRVGTNFEPQHKVAGRWTKALQLHFFVDSNGSLVRRSPKRDKTVTARQARIQMKRARRVAKLGAA